MPLSIEVLLPEHNNRWYQLRSVKPDSKAAAMPQILPDGGRKVYVFDCDKSDDFSTMATYDIPSEIEDTQGAIHLIQDGEIDPSSVMTIKRGENYYYSVKTDEKSNRSIVVFSHD